MTRPSHLNQLHRSHHLLLPLLCAAALATCGGGDDSASSSGAAGTTGGATVAAAPLVITAASPATRNGTLGVAAAQVEAGSSNETLTTYAATDPYCRVAVYGLVGSVDGQRYFVELSFRKDNRSVGLLKLGDDTSLATLARVAAPVTGVAVDIANRRIGFTNVVISSTTTTITLNGALAYTTNVAPENRAACG